MSVLSTFTWSCDMCGAQRMVSEETSAWHDMTPSPPNDWTCFMAIPPEFREQSTSDVCDACPVCIASPSWDWFNYKRAQLSDNSEKPITPTNPLKR